ncbi:MAG: MBL fold metallo-hydrolase [Desulfobacteraceae bacterium]
MESKGLAICPLASGSQGNSVFVSGEKTAVLFDAGLSGIEIERRMSAAGVSPDKLTGIVISHEHADHVKGAGILSRRFNIPVYINRRTWQAAEKKLGSIQELISFSCGTPFNIGELEIDPFSISHDAADPAAFTCRHNNVKLGIATDMGIATSLVKEHLKNCDLLYLEANHDPEMLISGPYPWYLKQRVKGRKGHLSNGSTGTLLAEISCSRLHHVILSHLSLENNTPEKALQTISPFLKTEKKVTLDVARPDRPGKMVFLK